MGIHVTDFKWEKGKNDLQYIELLEKTLKNEQSITAKAVVKIRELSDKNKKIRNKAINEFAKRLKAKVEEKISLQMFIDEDDLLDKDQIDKYIEEIAEQMKGGV